MSKATKIWIIVAVTFVVAGIIILGVVMAMLKWDFLKLKYETNIYDIDDSFHNISIKTDTADVTVLPSDDGKLKVVCYESDKAKCIVSVENDTLIVNMTDTGKWYDHIRIGGWVQKITVYLPESEYGELDIKESTGKIQVENLYVKSLSLSVSTGNINISDIKCDGDIKIGVSTGKTNMSNIECKNLTSSGSTGNIDMSGVVANEKISVKRSTGDIKLDGCDAAELYLETTTGNVKGSLLSEKIFVVNTSTGKRNIPKTTSGGICEIITSTGDIKITIE